MLSLLFLLFVGWHSPTFLYINFFSFLIFLLLSLFPTFELLFIVVIAVVVNGGGGGGGGVGPVFRLCEQHCREMQTLLSFCFELRAQVLVADKLLALNS